MTYSFGTDWSLSAAERKRVRTRFWIGFTVYLVAYLGVISPLMHHWRGPRADSAGWNLAQSLCMGALIAAWQFITPAVGQEERRRRLHLKIDDDGYTRLGRTVSPLVLRREEVLEAQRTPTGALWLVTNLRRRRIEVPSDFPELAELRALLQERGVVEKPPSRWVVSYLLPTLALWGVAVAAVAMMWIGEHRNIIIAGWVVFTLLTGFQIYQARRDKSYEADGAVALLGVVMMIAAIMAMVRGAAH